MKNLLTTFLAAALTLFSAPAFAQSYEHQGVHIANVEYWAHGGYDGGNGVSFGVETGKNEWSIACGKKAFEELKAIVAKGPADLTKMAEQTGRNTFYVIISDWTGKTFQKGSTWFYGDRIQKFHCGTKSRTSPTQPLTCDCPSERSVLDLAKTAHH